MSTQIEKTSQIPDAPYYAVAKDEFMSGWGRSEGKDNWVVFPCDSMEEAEIVKENLKNRSDMRRARINKNKPIVRKGVLLSLMDKEEASRFYRKGGFTGESIRL